MVVEKTERPEPTQPTTQKEIVLSSSYRRACPWTRADLTIGRLRARKRYHALVLSGSESQNAVRVTLETNNAPEWCAVQAEKDIQATR